MEISNENELKVDKFINSKNFIMLKYIFQKEQQAFSHLKIFESLKTASEIIEDNIYYNDEEYHRGYFDNVFNLFSNNLLMCLCKQKYYFKFYPLEGFKDNSIEIIEEINKKIYSNVEIITEFLKILNKLEIKEESISFKDNDESITLIISENLQKYNNFLKFLSSFTDRELMTIMGFRSTPGSVDELPPNKAFLNEYFNKLHTTVHNIIIKEIPKNSKIKPSKLTVGGRALSKHSHRSSEMFWPKCEGKEVEKNEKANNILNYFLNECVWINVHGLPGNIATIELRDKNNYGIRWLVNGEFRGFLEPPMDDGHEKGWRH